jgi:hypothetical protein
MWGGFHLGDYPAVRFSTTLAALGLATLLAATPAAGQSRVPAPQTYRFVSELGNAAGIWVNPGAMGYFDASLLTGSITFDRPESSWEVGQYQFGIQWGPLGFGYTHDEFHDTTGFGQADNYTVSAGFATNGNGAGAARTWRKVGDAEASWDIGYTFVSQAGVSFGLTWRDIGSPVVRDTVLDERVVGAVTFREATTGRFSISAQAEYKTKLKEFRGFRVGGSLKPVDSVEILVLAQWGGDGDFDGFSLGFYLTDKSAMGWGVVGLESNGDIRTGNAGASFMGQRTGL